MSKPSLEATSLIHDALLMALIRTHPNPKEAFNAFSHICPDIVRYLSKASPDNAQLVADFQSEWNRFAAHFPKG